MRKTLFALALVAIVLFSIAHVAVASRNGHENTHVQREIQSAEQQQRALEQIQAAEEMIVQADSLIDSLTCEPPHAAVVLLDQAKEHLANAREAFDKSKYGEAYGLANAAKHLAQNAIKKIEEVEQHVEENIGQSPAEEKIEHLSSEENVDQPTKEDLEPPAEINVEQPVLYEVPPSYSESVLLQLIGFRGTPDSTCVGKGKVLTIKIVGPREVQLGGTIEANVANNSNATISIEVYSFYHKEVISDSELFEPHHPAPPGYVKSSVKTVDLAPGEAKTLSLGNLEPDTYTFGVVAMYKNQVNEADQQIWAGPRPR